MIRQNLRWRKCSEVMPDYFTDVLVSDGKYVELKWLHDYNYWESFTEGQSDIPSHAVIYWMPLPKAPEGF